MRWSPVDYAKARIQKEVYTPDPTLSKTGNKIMEMTNGGEAIGQKSGMVGTELKKRITSMVVKKLFGA